MKGLQKAWNNVNSIHDVSGMAVIVDLLYTDFF